MDQTYTERNTIAISGDNLVAGGKAYPLSEVRGVRVAFRVPSAMRNLFILAVAIFAMTMALLLSVATTSVFSGTAELPGTAETIGYIFFAGMALYVIVFAIAMLKYRVVWTVELDTTEGSHTVYRALNRTDAQTYEKKLTRELGQRI